MITPREMRQILICIQAISENHQKFWRLVAEQKSRKTILIFEPYKNRGLEIRIGDCVVNLYLEEDLTPMLFFECSRRPREGGQVAAAHVSLATEIYRCCLAVLNEIAA